MMNNYIDHIYDESFNECMVEFDIFVQEGVGLVVGVVLGIGALITAIILLVKKFFFDKSNPTCNWNVLSKLEERLKAHTGKITMNTSINLNSYNNGLDNLTETMKNMLNVANNMKDYDTVKNEIITGINNAKTSFENSVNVNESNTKSEDTSAILSLIQSAKTKSKALADSVKALSKKNKEFQNAKNQTEQQKNFTELHTKLTEVIKLSNDKLNAINKGIKTEKSDS